MTARRAFLVVAACAAIHGGGASAAEFADMVRDLNVMQNRMVMGDSNAQATVARQFDLVEQTLGAIDPEVWREEKNVRAAAIYLLCGGAPTQLRDFYDAGFVSKELAPLLDASLSYAEGQGGAVTQALMNLDAHLYSPMLGGHLALVQGGSIVGVDQAKAVALFDLARLLMPASLVEEAAIRREVAVLDPLREIDKLALLANRYVSKYLASPYAQDFWGRLHEIILDTSRDGDDAFFAKFATTIGKADAARRLDIYLTLTRRDLLRGRIGPATQKLEKADNAADTPAARRRIAAYRTVLRALSAGESTGVAAVNELDFGGLPREDMEALKIARAVMGRLEAPVENAKLENQSKANEATAAAGDEPAIVTRARDALSRSDELLKGAAKP